LKSISAATSKWHKARLGSQHGLSLLSFDFSQRAPLPPGTFKIASTAQTAKLSKVDLRAENN
jgi:hypothetical protein